MEKLFKLQLKSSCDRSAEDVPNWKIILVAIAVIAIIIVLFALIILSIYIKEHYVVTSEQTFANTALMCVLYFFAYCLAKPCFNLLYSKMTICENLAQIPFQTLLLQFENFLKDHDLKEENKI